MIDIDGTFLFDSSEVEKSDLAAFLAAEEKCEMSIATGRSIAEIEYLERKYNIQLAYKIGFNGALIIDKSGQIIFDQPIERQTLSSLANYLESEKIICDSLDGKKRIGNFKHEKSNQLLGLSYKFIENPYSIIRNQKVYKINLRPETLEEATKITEYLKVIYPDLSIFQVGKKRIEISAGNTSKGNALRKISQEHLITVAIGDSENDVSMFEYANFSYCIDTAPVYVQEKAMYNVSRFHEAIKHFSKKGSEE